MLTNANKCTYLVKNWQKYANVICERPLVKTLYLLTITSISCESIFAITSTIQILGQGISCYTSYCKRISISLTQLGTKVHKQLDFHEVI